MGSHSKQKYGSDEGIEKVPSELEDAASSPLRYEIATHPADFTLEVLHHKWKRKGLIIPDFQRRFVWSQVQASRLIESFLLGLPVPSVFFYIERSKENFLVIDGQQRLRSVFYFFEGFFGEEVRGRRPIFRLTGLNEKSPWINKTFENLKTEDESIANRLRDSVMRAFVVRQLNPDDNSSLFHIFERLNTGGTLLNPQEIRNCIYGGVLNNLIHEFNNNAAWRDIFGKKNPDKRMRDIELILRFLALYENRENYRKPMKEFLSDFIRTNRDVNEAGRDKYEKLFSRVVNTVVQSLGPKPFHIRAGLNAAAFDAVFVALADYPEISGENLREGFDRLIHSKPFEDLTTAATTDVDIVKQRIELVRKILSNGD